MNYQQRHKLTNPPALWLYPSPFLIQATGQLDIYNQRSNIHSFLRIFAADIEERVSKDFLVGSQSR